MGHDIRYIPRTATKSQALADFVTKWIEVQLPTPDVTHEYWTMYFDGSIMALDSGIGVVLISPNGSRLRYAICLHFSASNNTMEYEALINGLRIAIELGATRLYVCSDSELVVDQVIKESSCKSPLMAAYCQKVCKLKDKFQGIELHHIPRKDNDAADFLIKLASRWDPSPCGVFINNVHEPSARILEGPIQTHPDARPAPGGSEPDAKPAPGGSDPNAKPALRGSDPSTFIVLVDKLYKWSPSRVLIKCIPTNQGKQLLLEVHVRICEHHVALRSLVGKAFRQGFY
ncbi:uncharacterized protein [Miscanthus floridulus]|uniref:uncharacterized protein n=1 Tax=Miscanthus floridulus TaxID=154761 RepID=UPI00345962DC